MIAGVGLLTWCLLRLPCNKYIGCSVPVGVKWLEVQNNESEYCFQISKLSQLKNLHVKWLP